MNSLKIYKTQLTNVVSPVVSTPPAFLVVSVAFEVYRNTSWCGAREKMSTPGPQHAMFDYDMGQ